MRFSTKSLLLALLIMMGGAKVSALETYDFQELCMKLGKGGPWAVNDGGDAGFTLGTEEAPVVMHYLGDYTDQGFTWNQRFAYEYVDGRGKFTMRNKSNKKDKNCGMFSWDYAHNFSILGLKDGDKVTITIPTGTVTFVSETAEGVSEGDAVTSDQAYTITTTEESTRLDIQMASATLIAKIVIEPYGVETIPTIKLNKEMLALIPGATAKLTASVDPAGIATQWKSDNEAVATIADDGTVTAIAAGTATITNSWASEVSDATAEDACVVTVTDVDLSKYKIVRAYDFTTMGDVTLELQEDAAGAIWNDANSKPNDVFFCTNEGLEQIAVQAAVSSNKGWSIVDGQGLFLASGAGRCAAVADIKTGQIVEFIYTGDGFYTRSDDDGIEKTALNESIGHAIYQADEDGMIGFELVKGNAVKQINIYEFDYTNYIVNADLTGEGGFDATGTKGIDGSGIVKCGNNAQFDFSQTIKGLPAGKYLLTAQAAYRYGGSEADEAAAIAAGTETKLASLYATVDAKTVSTPVQNRYDGASETDLAGSGTAIVNDLYVPNSSAAVQAWFNAGKYVNEVEFNLPADGDVKIGIAKTAQPEFGDYTVIGPWTLTRIGEAEEEPVVEDGSYVFVASEWIAGDAGRISPDNVVFNADNTITVSQTGQNNVALLFRSENVYTVKAEKRYFVIKGTGLSTAEGDSYLWWLNNTNDGSQIKPTDIYEEDGQTVFAWDCATISIGGQLGLSDTEFKDEGGWSTTFGLTLADQEVPAVISYIGFEEAVANPVEEFVYEFVASEWPAGDPGRISPNNVVVDEAANTITVNATGDNNVALNFKTDKIYYLPEPVKYFVIVATGLSTEEGKSYLWWLNAKNNGGQVAPTDIVSGEQTTFVWDITADDTFASGFSADGKTYLDGTGASTWGWTTTFGLTLADANVPAVISYIGYETEDSPVVTAINSTRSNTTVSHAIYNLAGQRVMNAQKGLYIINGKKVMF